jgi:hypothetical protein
MRVDQLQFLIPNSSFLIPHLISGVFNGVACVRDLKKRNFKKRKQGPEQNAIQTRLQTRPLLACGLVRGCCHNVRAAQGGR